jgi:galactose mutarotase-like enzyme
VGRLDIRTNQPAVQVYTAWLNIPRKAAHGGAGETYGPRSTVAIEQEGWLDAINTPEWGIDQICESDHCHQMRRRADEDGRRQRARICVGDGVCVFGLDY